MIVGGSLLSAVPEPPDGTLPLTADAAAVAIALVVPVSLGGAIAKVWVPPPVRAMPVTVLIVIDCAAAVRPPPLRL